MSFKDILDIIQQVLSFLGVKDETSKYLIAVLGVISIGLVVLKQIYNWFTKLLRYFRKKKLAKDLHPFYTDKEIDTATRYYIKTNFQNVAPSEDEEPGRNYIAAASEPLIPLFLDKAFRNNKDDNKYYLVLADSGMGKTTFMINLYLSYKYKTTWFWQRSKFDIKLFPMGHPNTILRINEMTSPEKENCILLLDAFDEDNESVINYEKRLNEILALVWEFREIVITCRTQFFPTSKSEPTETGRFKFGGEGGEHHFQKIYLSVFSEKDIKHYLKKRFKPILGFFSNFKYMKAYAIVMKSPNLMMRPMLLSYIEDLIEVNKRMQYGFQIYEALIEQWLVRESKKAGIRLKYGDKYKDLLSQFSKALARDLYINRSKRNNKLSLQVNEIIDNPGGLQLVDIEGNLIEIDKYDQGSRSLLNRNAIGEYKFSHKSILEYFLALEVLENEHFRQQFYFDADLDTAKRFFMERLRKSNFSEEVTKGFSLQKLGILEEDIAKFALKGYLPMSLREFYSSLFKTVLSDKSLFLALPLLVFLILFTIKKHTTIVVPISEKTELTLIEKIIDTTPVEVPVFMMISILFIVFLQLSTKFVQINIIINQLEKEIGINARFLDALQKNIKTIIDKIVNR